MKTADLHVGQASLLVKSLVPTSKDACPTALKSPRRWTGGGQISAAVLFASGALLSIALAGCSMCCGTHDYDYPVFDSAYTRMDPVYGRVGSVFSDPNAGPGTRRLTNAEVPRERDSLEDSVNADDPLNDDPEFNRQPQNQVPPDKTEEKNPFQGVPDTGDDGQDTAVQYRNPIPAQQR